jgi:hypothetical protein
MKPFCLVNAGAEELLDPDYHDTAEARAARRAWARLIKKIMNRTGLVLQLRQSMSYLHESTILLDIARRDDNITDRN